MLELFKFFIDNLVYIIILSIILLVLLVISSMINRDLTDIHDKPIQKIVTIEK